MRKEGRERSFTHDENSRVFSNSFRETFGTLLLDDVPPSGSARGRSVENL